MTRHAYANLVLFAIVAYLLYGCATIGVPPAQNFEQKWAYATATHTAVMSAAAASVKVGDLSKADGQQVLRLADEARALLDAAEALSSSDESAANQKLALASTILLQLQQYLRART